MKRYIHESPGVEVYQRSYANETQYELELGDWLYGVATTPTELIPQIDELIAGLSAARIALSKEVL